MGESISRVWWQNDEVLDRVDNTVCLLAAPFIVQTMVGHLSCLPLCVKAAALVEWRVAHSRPPSKCYYTSRLVCLQPPHRHTHTQYKLGKWSAPGYWPLSYSARKTPV
ncbi:hypothetical protein AAG570_006406 [Ranatra chinensis]|uniref:Uncharacterized protein n=1 Tax=Ranatra chinensis TaxID=642074 RepID=A0ABD0Z4H9_9HEMI